MKLLTTKQKISKYLKISLHRKEEDIDRYIREAQLFDFQPLVCPEFFQDLTGIASESDYSELLSGGNYFRNGKEITFEGLEAVLAYFVYARYIFKSHQVDTPFGFVQKKNNDSEPLSQTERRDMQKMYVQQAHVLWDYCKLYLNERKVLYPTWEKCYGCNEPERVNRIKVSFF